MKEHKTEKRERDNNETEKATQRIMRHTENKKEK